MQCTATHIWPGCCSHPKAKSTYTQKRSARMLGTCSMCRSDCEALMSSWACFLCTLPQVALCSRHAAFWHPREQKRASSHPWHSCRLLATLPQ
jgi:hypothetical protein